MYTPQNMRNKGNTSILLEKMRVICRWAVGIFGIIMNILIFFVLGLPIFASEMNFTNTPPIIMISRFYDFRIDSDPEKLIMATWENGETIWSTNLFTGGKPYFYGKISETNNINNILVSFEDKGYFDTKLLKQDRMGADSQYIELFISFGTNIIHTRSWHEIYELNPGIIASSSGLLLLNGRNRETVLRNDKIEYQQYRAAWTDIRSQLNNIIPNNGSIIENVKISIIRRKKYIIFTNN